MSESRLHHLRRQQALLKEHLNWIESEISRETAGADATPPAVTASPRDVPGAPPATEPAPADDGDALLEQYARDERQNPADIRRGCLLIFIGMLALLAVGVTAIWLLRYR